MSEHLHENFFSFFFFSFLQLLNQFENTGPPPADREKIKSLPTVQITEEHVGRSKVIATGVTDTFEK